MKKLIGILSIAICLIACQQEKAITDLQDYEAFLPASLKNEKTLDQEVAFWSARLDKDSIRISTLSKLAQAHSTIFNAKGTIENLKIAETLLTKGLDHAHIGRTGFLRSLAHNYITQHRFNEAKTLLLEAYELKPQKGTAFMLFDVHMELGSYENARDILDQVRNPGDFNYLIRESKWMDYKGNLETAIEYLELATDIAESGNQEDLMYWSYTNLADFYGHAGRLQESYNMYLKALSLNPDDAYALKKIAWIAFSNDKNTKAAKHILEALKNRYHSPDIYLMEMEIASFEGDKKAKDKALNTYMKLVEQDHYGYMYDKYNVILYSEELKDSDRALALAQQEVNNRPTPQSYDLLAWAYFNKGYVEKALEISERYVYEKTFEPESLYHQAQIFKANFKLKRVKRIKQELEGSIFELGPEFKNKIDKL